MSDKYPGMSNCCGKSHCDCDTKPFYSKNEARILLKQQREICAEEYLRAYESENEEDAIRNAPEPKI